VTEEATSFGEVAGDYDRVRPMPAPQALDWLVPDGCAVAVDVAAGTGLFTRALQQRAGQVIAVEPDERMRSVLAATSPGVRVLAGWGEALPLPDSSADGVFVSTAWHWLDPDRAVPEIARVLRPGGRLGVLWSSRDREADWIAELDLLLDPDKTRTIADVRTGVGEHRTVRLPAGAPFGNVSAASFPYARTVTVPDAVTWVGTTSRMIVSSPADRAAGLATARRVFTEHAHGDTVEVPMRSWCWRADRLP
jgi:SAM-dependent methyltransferase